MVDLYDLGKSIKPSLIKHYPLVDVRDLPEERQIERVIFREDEIEQAGEILIYRIMKHNYGEPSEIVTTPQGKAWIDSGIKRITFARDHKGTISDPAVLTQEQLEVLQTEKTMRGINLEWRYFIRTKSGAIIQVGSKNKSTLSYVSYVLHKGVPDPSGVAVIESEKFVDELIKEISLHGKRLFEPKKQFEKGEGIQLYLLHNVYLYNYGSARLLLERSEDLENSLAQQFIKYDPRDDISDPTRIDHVRRYQVALGMFYASCISYYFMALEGFVNLIFHSFLKHEYRANEFDWERRLDLEQKLQLMPALCSGFKTEYIDTKSDVFADFRKLRKYRNQFFHSKIVDSLKSVCIVEDGFFFNSEFGNAKNELLPSQKMFLKKSDATAVKDIVDRTIQNLLEKMDLDSRDLAKKYIENETEVPFWKDEEGNVRMGTLKDGN